MGERGIIVRAREGRGVKAGERAGRLGHSWGKRRGVKVGGRGNGGRGEGNSRAKHLFVKK